MNQASGEHRHLMPVFARCLVIKQEEEVMGYRDFGNQGPRQMYTATCSDCGKETEVPFKPAEGRPVYCRDCYQKHKPKRDSY